MPWRDDLRDMIYTAPSGAEFTLRFSEVSREGGKKAPVNEFPGQNQGAVQDLGQTTPRYPISCYIDGADYHRTADRFWNALNEAGPGELQHPRWGVIKVLPISISQSERFVDGAGRATFQIDFVRTDEAVLEYPRTAKLASAQAQAAINTAATDVTATLDDVEIEEPGRLAALRDQVTGALDAVVDGFDAVTGFTDDVRAEINKVVSGITNQIDTLVQAPADLADSLLQLYRTPADVITDVKEKVDGYKAMFDTMVDAAVATTQRYGETFGLIGSAQVQGVMVGACEASLTGTTTTRADAIEAIETLSTLSESIAQAVEDMGVEDYQSFSSTRRAVAATLNALIESSLALPAERVYTADNDVPLPMLVYELYGVDADIEAMMDRLIDYNGLAGANIVRIPRGAEVRWYV